MIVKTLETIHCDAGWRPWTFIKITTREGLVGWSEVTDSHGAPRGLSGIVEDLAPLVVGRDPRATEKIFWDLYRATRQTPGGLIQKAIGGIENALLDLKGKALGVPVYELFGGPTRNFVPAYWSHCATTRARAWQVTKTPKLTSYDDVVTLGREVVQRGFTALKTNVVIPGEAPEVYMPGFKDDIYNEMRPTRDIIGALERLMTAFREGVGANADIILDLNFNFKTKGNIKILEAMDRFKLMWIEIDCFDPSALANVKQATARAIASGENLYTARQFLPFFQAHAMDIAIVDIIWNGFAQSKKIADLADVHELSVAPHNYNGNLATFISAQFCAAISNSHILEMDVDDVPWKDTLTTEVPDIRNGRMLIPNRPGWGCDINEDVLREHPWPRK